ncbi:hypothetical protein [Nitrosospira multiformis]|uniref:hypothetical protein n=1 Tax=Nitrosospira multiformis TaxID=1231 RepID=UPI0015A6F211|nr:hypothetical protein [Nitrosospira multiformis]
MLRNALINGVNNTVYSALPYPLPGAALSTAAKSGIGAKRAGGNLISYCNARGAMLLPR